LGFEISSETEVPADVDLADLRRACAAPVPHPDDAALRGFAEQTLDYLLRHHATLPEQPIGRGAARAEMEALLREPPPERGQDFAAVLARFTEDIAPFACRIGHPRFLAFVPSAPTFLSALGDFLCAGTNFFGGVWVEASGPSQVELVVLDWFRDFLGLPPQTSGVLTSGGSEANLTALVVARERLADADRPRAVLYVAEQRHWSIDRAAKIIGLRAEQVRPVADDADFRLSPAALRDAVARDRTAGRVPWVAVANAGATNTGAVDPLAALADVCAAERLWLHADAAYGWTAALTPEGRAELGEVERADSVTLDPHKWLAQTFEAGCLLVRDGRLLARTFAMRPEYMQDVEPGHDEVNFADRGLALTRRFRALKIWLSLKVLGVGWFRELVAHSLRLAEFAQRLLEADETFEVLSPRRLSIVCFRYAPPAVRGRDPEELDRLNLQLIDALRATGRAFLSSTRLRGRVAIRFCFVNWRTTAADVEEIVGLLRELGNGLASE
jgi:glutamate/tyrosine decarboxylase-like PLP-dependent enzyme